jgi:hypothetical protein
MVTENQLPPPLPEEQHVKATNARNLLISFASRSKAAGLLIAKQIRRTNLLKVTLPGHYRALGKQLHVEGRYWDEFPATFQAIDALLGQIKAVEARPANEPKAEGIAPGPARHNQAQSWRSGNSTLALLAGVAFPLQGPQEPIRPAPSPHGGIDARNSGGHHRLAESTIL